MDLSAKAALVNDAERKYLDEVFDCLPDSMSDFLADFLRRLAPAPATCIVEDAAADLFDEAAKELHIYSQTLVGRAADRVDSLVNKLRAARVSSSLGGEAGGWVPVGERLPEAAPATGWPPYRRVLVARPSQDVKTGYLHNEAWYVEGEDFDGEALLDNTVTHWQPLPAAPHVS
jgi:hypothetical protein